MDFQVGVSTLKFGRSVSWIMREFKGEVIYSGWQTMALNRTHKESIFSTAVSLHEASGSFMLL